MLHRTLFAGSCLLTGCINYADLAADQAVAELDCPREQVQVEETALGQAVKVKATGCSRFANYYCYSAARGTAGGSEQVCELVDASADREAVAASGAPAASEGEATCRATCGSGGESCRSSCTGGDCSAMCASLEQGCIKGCLDALARQ